MRRIAYMLGIVPLLCVVMSCTYVNKEEKGQDISFEIMDEDEIPEKMRTIIAEEQEKMFRISFEEDDWIYIGHGYGKQEIDGYRIEVDTCQASEHFVYVHTVLIGPETVPKKQISSCPYVVFRVKEHNKKVIFLN